MPRESKIKKADTPQHIPVPVTSPPIKPLSEQDRRVDFGVSGLNRVGEYVFEEFLPELRGQRGMKTLREMRDNDATAGAMLFLLEQLVKQVDQDIKPFGEKPTPQAIEEAQFIHTSLFEDMAKTWPETQSEICSMFWAGFAPLEVTWKRRQGEGPGKFQGLKRVGKVFKEAPAFDQAPSRYSDGLWGWDKWAVRAQETIYRWQFDERNEWQAFVQQAPPDWRIRVVPRDKTLLFRVKSDRDNPEGRSLLRNAVISWIRKKKLEVIEGIGIERNLDGLPVLTTPEGTDIFNASDANAVAQLAAAKKLVKGIRVDEQMGVVKPFGWTLELLSSSGGARSMSADKAITRYEHRMAMSIAMDFIFLGSGPVGARAQAEVDVGLFTTAFTGILNSIEGVINRQAIPDLYRLNGKPTNETCKFAFGETGKKNLGSLAAYITSLAQAGMELFPDPELEHALREAGGLPEAEGGQITSKLRKKRASFWRNKLRSHATHLEPFGTDRAEFVAAVRELREGLSKALEKGA